VNDFGLVDAEFIRCKVFKKCSIRKVTVEKDTNRALNQQSEATAIRAIPMPTGVRKETLAVRMKEFGEIPDGVLTFEEIGGLLDSWKVEACAEERSKRNVGKGGGGSPSKADSDEAYRMAVARYESLVRQLSPKAPK
jgi:hypothetical protein